MYKNSNKPNTKLVSSEALPPSEWLKNVHGQDALEQLKDEGITLEWAFKLMEWYGDYIKKKSVTEKNAKNG